MHIAGDGGSGTQRETGLAHSAGTPPGNPGHSSVGTPRGAGTLVHQSPLEVKGDSTWARPRDPRADTVEPAQDVTTGSSIAVARDGLDSAKTRSDKFCKLKHVGKLKWRVSWAQTEQTSKRLSVES